MTPGMWIGLLAGVFIGWFIGAVFTEGPKTPLEAFNGDFDSSGPGCFAFLVLIVFFGGVGVIAGALFFSS